MSKVGLPSARSKIKKLSQISQGHQGRVRESQHGLYFFVFYLFPLFLPLELPASSELVVIFPRVSTPFDTPLTAFPTPRLIPLVPLSAKLRLLPILLLRIVRKLLVV